MNEDIKPKTVLSGEVFSPQQSLSRSDSPSLQLHLPPGVAGMGLGQALLGQLPYWGLKRTIDAYRKAVESGIDMQIAVTRFYESARGLEAEKARWENSGSYRDAAALEAEAFLDGARAMRDRAETARIASRMELNAVRRREADMEFLLEIEKNNREAELLRSELVKEEIQKKINAVRDEPGGGGYNETRRQMVQRQKDYESLMKAKAEDIKKYGGEENFPEFVRIMYRKLEETLTFGEE